MPDELEVSLPQPLQVASKPKATPVKAPPAPKPSSKPVVVKPPPLPPPEPPVAPPRVDVPAQPQLPQSNYPKAKPRNASQAPDPFAEPFPAEEEPELPKYREANPDEEAAYPTYHPPVVIDGWVDEQALYIRFDVKASGAFRASIVEGTGTPAFDAIALKVVKQWKWQPKRVRGRAVASTEVIRLKRNEDRPAHHF